MKIEILKARGGYRWHIVAGNNAVTASSRNAYPEQRKAIAAAKKVRADMARAEIVVVE